MNEMIIPQESIAQIAQNAPEAFNANVTSHDKALAFGQSLLDTIEANGGQLTDELDQQVAKYIDRAKKTVKKMNDGRSPLTQLFDEIRKKFTALENDVDPTKSGTIPHKLQQYRNQYAAKKHAEEEQRRRELQQEQMRKAAIEKYRMDVTEALHNTLNDCISSATNIIMTLNQQINLDNIVEFAKKIADVPTVLECSAFKNISVIPSPLISQDVLDSVKMDVWSATFPEMKQAYANEVGAVKQSIIDLIPSKKIELERAANAGAEEAERIRKEMAERDAQEAARKEQERIEREQKEKQEALLAKQNASMNNLFDQAAAQAPAYQPKVAVKKKIELLDAEGILPIIQMWFLDEGCKLTTEELAKTFKKQITFCEKQANDKTNPVFITSEHLAYVDDVKAK